MISGLRELLEQIEPWDEIKSIIPGKIRPARSAGQLILKVQYNTSSGVKCLAQSNSAIQEVFIVTPQPELFKQRLERFLGGG